MKKNIIIVTIFFVSFFSFANTSPDYPQIGTINVSATNIYKKPSPTSNIIKELKNSEPVIKIKEEGDFYQIILADSLIPNGWIKKETLNLKNLEGKIEGKGLEVLKKFLSNYLGDSIKFYTQPFFEEEPLVPVQFLDVETLIIKDRVFFIVDYPFTGFEEHKCCVTPLLTLEWKEDNLIARNFYEWSNYEGLLNKICYFWHPNAKEIKKKFLIAEIYEYLIEDYEKAIKEYDSLRILFKDDLYTNGIYGEGAYYGSSRIKALRNMARAYNKLNKKEEALACLYKILDKYPNDTIGGWEWEETADFGAARDILEIDSTLEECEKLKSASNSIWIHAFVDFWELKYFLKRGIYPIEEYLQFINKYYRLYELDELDDKYQLFKALEEMLIFLDNEKLYDLALLLTYKTYQSMPKDFLLPSFPYEKKKSPLDYFIKNDSELKWHLKYLKYELGIIKAEKVALRVKPGLEEKLVTCADSYERISIMESQGDWSKILRYDGEVGWVQNKHIRKIPRPNSLEDISVDR